MIKLLLRTLLLLLVVLLLFFFLFCCSSSASSARIFSSFRVIYSAYAGCDGGQSVLHGRTWLQRTRQGEALGPIPPAALAPLPHSAAPLQQIVEDVAVRNRLRSGVVVSLRPWGGK